MASKILFLVSALILSSVSSAQEYALLVGVHQTTAKADAPGVTTSGVLNWKVGMNMAFELVPGLRFRTGAIYNERHVDVKIPGLTASQPTQKLGYNFAYVDVPANVQYNFNEMVGIFGGLIIGINVGDDVKLPSGYTGGAVDAEPKSLIPLVDAGFNFMFADMIGFDLYYEYGLGDAAKDFGKYSTFGGNFLCWF